ncbi:hypothetical protein GCM10010121_058890 [Streptomyces brasiliensis]|uniref:Uncharacterized protein n=1 Tax=Streptomyces brasiliensis TaxID=1954 RepID=A0A917NY66_9ACTN|nr:hypothetical protein GCM10010121_058890 [Streptomyces brasiliensis]
MRKVTPSKVEAYLRFGRTGLVPMFASLAVVAVRNTQGEGRFPTAVIAAPSSPRGCSALFPPLGRQTGAAPADRPPKRTHVDSGMTAGAHPASDVPQGAHFEARA